MSIKVTLFSLDGGIIPAIKATVPFMLIMDNDGSFKKLLKETSTKNSDVTLSNANSLKSYTTAGLKDEPSKYTLNGYDMDNILVNSGLSSQNRTILDQLMRTGTVVLPSNTSQFTINEIKSEFQDNPLFEIEDTSANIVVDSTTSDGVVKKYEFADQVQTNYEKSVRASLSEIYQTVEKGIAVHYTAIPNNNPTDTKLETDYVTQTPQGIEQGYFQDTWQTENPNYVELTGATFVRTHNDDGVFIGSLPLTYPFTYHEELDSDLNQCKDWKLSLPSFCNTEGLLDLIDKLVPKDKDSLTWKTIEEINKLADEVDKVPEAKQLITILSQEYKSLPEQIKNRFSPQLKALILDYSLVQTPNKEPEYDDLSAYLSAPFPDLNVQAYEDSDELKKLLEKLKELGLEDLNIPLVQVTNEDLTDRSVDGTGIFDHIASSIFNQLSNARSQGLITQGDIAGIYSQFLVQGIQTASQFALEKANLLNQSYAMKIQAAQASVAVLQAKAEMLMLPAKLRLAYAQVEAQLKQIDLLKVQIELEKEKFPQVVAQTDLILAQTDGQRLTNEQVQVAIQGGKLGLEQTKEQIALMKEQNKQAIIQTETMDSQRKVQEIQIELVSKQVDQAEEQTKQIVLSNNKLVEDTKMVDAQTQYQLKQVELADIQKITAKAQIKLMAQQLEKEKENLGLIKAQTATAMSQLSLIKDQLKASKAQYSDTIDGKPVGGLLGAQIAVNKVQATSYERKAFMEVVSNLQSGWAANKTADIAISSPAAYTPMVVDRALSWAMTKYFNMPADVMSLPKDYSPYLTDGQMDAEESVSYKVDKTIKKNTTK